jgi:hypothetical protein
LREAARRVGRDVRAVHSDVHMLLQAGVFRKDDKGRIVFPCTAVHVDFMRGAGVAALGPPIVTMAAWADHQVDRLLSGTLADRQLPARSGHSRPAAQGRALEQVP